MEITRNVILDLLPLYSADEVSADTRTLIEDYLKTDPELAKLAKQMTAMQKKGDVPVPLTQDDEIRAYRRAMQRNLIRTIVIAGAISILLVTLVLIFFFSSS